MKVWTYENTEHEDGTITTEIAEHTATLKGDWVVLEPGGDHLLMDRGAYRSEADAKTAAAAARRDALLDRDRTRRGQSIYRTID